MICCIIALVLAIMSAMMVVYYTTKNTFQNKESHRPDLVGGSIIQPNYVNDTPVPTESLTEHMITDTEIAQTVRGSTRGSSRKVSKRVIDDFTDNNIIDITYKIQTNKINSRPSAGSAVSMLKHPK